MSESESGVPNLPESMVHLCSDQMNLLIEVSTKYAAAVKTMKESGDDELPPFFLGAINQGVPTDPSKPTTCGYLTVDLPSPDLGDLPRDEIIKELESDQCKTIKQRRDLSGADTSPETSICLVLIDRTLTIDVDVDVAVFVVVVDDVDGE